MEVEAPKQKKRRLTKKQKDFADKYLETGIGNLSVYEAKYDVKNDETARAIASENLTKPNVRQYLEENASAVAANMLKLALNAEKESDQISAGKDVLDRAGYKPTEKTINVNVHEELPADKLKELADRLIRIHG